MTTQDFIFNVPLYTKVKVSETQILDDFCNDIRIDGYNPVSGADSIYYLKRGLDPRFFSEAGTRLLYFVCQRYGDELYVLINYDVKKDYVQKVGQYPSVADIHIGQVKKYRKVLGESYIRDFTKAIGLAANGIGTGSFVYLRRIFEHLVAEIAEEAIKNGEIDKAQYVTSKMDNRLKLLSSYLPEMILNNKPLYGVLSVGIHELSEEQCLNYFSIVREVIELILDEREYNRQKEEKKKIAQAKLGYIAGEVKR